MLTLLWSMRKYNQDPVNLYLLSTKFSKDSEDKLTKFCKDLNIECFVKRTELDKVFKKKFHYTSDMYLRILAFKLLPENVEKILYLDADMLFLSDVKKIYDQDISNVKFACVRDPGHPRLKFLTRLGGGIPQHFKILHLDHDYFNSGMLLMNLKNIRQAWNEDLVFQTFENNKKHLSYPDQDVLNLMCKKEDLKFLDFGCNYQILHKEKLNNSVDLTLIHYVGPVKPWTAYFLKKHEKLYWADGPLENFNKITLKQKFSRTFKKLFKKK